MIVFLGKKNWKNNLSHHITSVKEAHFRATHTAGLSLTFPNLKSAKERKTKRCYI